MNELKLLNKLNKLSELSELSELKSILLFKNILLPFRKCQ